MYGLRNSNWEMNPPARYALEAGDSRRGDYTGVSEMVVRKQCAVVVGVGEIEQESCEALKTFQK